MESLPDTRPRDADDRGDGHPLLMFVLVGLLPVVVLSAGGSVVASLASLASVFPALAAVLATSDGAREPVPAGLAKRLLLAGGVVALLGGSWLARSGLGNPAYSAFTIGVPVLLTAWILSGAYSPVPAVRRLVRALVAEGVSLRAFLVAVLAWPAALAFTLALCARLPGLSVTLPSRSGLALLGSALITGVFSSALLAIGWYGFAARRLSMRFSPLATGLVVGAAQWLIVWAPGLLPLNWNRPLILLVLCGYAAGGVAAVWVYDRSRGSLLAVWLMGIAGGASRVLSFVSIKVDAAPRLGTPSQVFDVAAVALAVALVVAGRMWRRPAPVDAATPAPGSAA